MLRAALLVPVLLAALAAGPTSPLPAVPPSPEEALRQGNRQFREEDYEGALASWTAAYEHRGDPALAYNAGTAAHQLGRLPEALLWYRHAEAAGLERDPWLRDNLALARRELREKGVAEIAPAGFWALWIRGAGPLKLAGAVLAWAALGCLWLGRSPAVRRALLAGLAVLSCAAFGAGVLLPARPAVVLEDCPEGPPAGSEVWVVPRRAGDWRVLGPSPLLRCPASSVSLVER